MAGMQKRSYRLTKSARPLLFLYARGLPPVGYAAMGAGRGAIQWKLGERIIPSEQHIPLPPQENYQAPFPPSLEKAPQD